MKVNAPTLLITVAAVVFAGCVEQDKPLPTDPREFEAMELAGKQSYPMQTVLLHNMQRVLDTQLDGDDRLRSFLLVQRLGGDSGETLELMAGVLAEPNCPEQLHNGVLGFLLEKDQPELAEHIVAALPKLSSPQHSLREGILDWLVRHPTEDVLAEVVKLWAQEASTTGPNEMRYRRIVEGIRGVSWDQALLGTMNARKFYARGSALEVMVARIPEFTLRRRFMLITPYTDATAAIKTFVERFSYLPSTRASLRATVSIHKTRQRMLDETARLSRKWGADFGYQFDIRDFHLISRMSRDPLRESWRKTELILTLATEFIRRRHVPYRPDGVASSYDGRFAPQVDSLSMSDLWNLYLLNEMLSRPRVQRALKIMAAQSQANHRSWGGLIFYKSGQAESILYPADEGPGDSKLGYNISQRGRIDARDAMCRFTVHFDNVDNAAQAGPNEAELRNGRMNNYYGLVLTSVDKDSFCGHYYNPAGTVVSLGKFSFGR